MGRVRPELAHAFVYRAYSISVHSGLTASTVSIIWGTRTEPVAARKSGRVPRSVYSGPYVGKGSKLITTGAHIPGSRWDNSLRFLFLAEKEINSVWTSAVVTHPSQDSSNSAMMRRSSVLFTSLLTAHNVMPDRCTVHVQVLVADGVRSAYLTDLPK
ncbi:hypothetical protein QTP70_005038, partial [Hemibagrus guttatus]